MATRSRLSPVWKQIEKPSGTGPAGLVSEEASTGDSASWKGQDRLQNEQELQQERGVVSCFPAHRDKAGEGVPWPGCDPEGHWTVTSNEICE